MKIELNIENRDEVTKFIRFLEDVTTALESARELEYERLVAEYGEDSVMKVGISGFALDVSKVDFNKLPKTPIVDVDSIIKLYIDKYNA